jgi:hypothetical protein
MGSEIGIYSHAARCLLARRRDLEDGKAEDCALIVARRFPASQHDSRFTGDSRLLVAILGHGAVGTHAGAIAAVRPDVARELFPPDFGCVTAGVVRVRYERPKPGSREPLDLAPELLEVSETPVTGGRAGKTKVRRIAPRAAGRGAGS